MVKSKPKDVGDTLEYKGHVLEGRIGVFGEQLVWECQECKARAIKKYQFKKIECDS